MVVAHRLSTIRSADMIVAVDAGRVVEVGTHQQLMENQALYHSLVTRQMEGKVREAFQILLPYLLIVTGCTDGKRKA